MKAQSIYLPCIIAYFLPLLFVEKGRRRSDESGGINLQAQYLKSSGLVCRVQKKFIPHDSLYLKLNQSLNSGYSSPLYCRCSV